MGKVLIVFHSQSGNTKTAAEAVAEGAKNVDGTDVAVKEALTTTTEDLLSCGAIAVGSPDYFGYMAGGLKDFFDRTYYPTQGSVTDKPCGVFVTHGGGGKAGYNRKLWIGSVNKGGVSLVSVNAVTPAKRKDTPHGTEYTNRRDAATDIPGRPERNPARRSPQDAGGGY